MTLSSALLLVAALASPPPDFVAAPSESVVEGPFGVLFVPRYDSDATLSADANADVSRLHSYLSAHPDADRDALAARLASRLRGVQHWQGELARQAADTPSSAPRLLDAQLRLSAEAAVLQQQLQILGVPAHQTSAPASPHALTTSRPPASPAPSATEASTATDRIALGRDVVVAAGEVTRDAMAFGGDVVIEGHVTNDAVAFGGDIFIRDGGRLDGHPVSWGGRVEVDPGAHAPAARSTPPTPTSPTRSLLRRLFTALFFGGSAALVSGLLPAQTRRIGDRGITRPLASATLGALVASLSALFSFLLALTIIGLPFALLVLSTVSLMWLVGLTALGDHLGRRIPGPLGPSLGLAGTALFVAFAFDLGLPGAIAFLTLSTYAVGATALARFGRAKGGSPP